MTLVRQNYSHPTLQAVVVHRSSLRNTRTHTHTHTKSAHTRQDNARYKTRLLFYYYYKVYLIQRGSKHLIIKLSKDNGIN